MEHRTLSLGAKLTYAIIRRSEMYAIDKGKAKDGYFWLTRAAIASKLHRSPRKISDYIKELVDAGIIQRRCIPSNHNGLVIHDFFRIDWEVVRGLELDEAQASPSLYEEETTSKYVENPDTVETLEIINDRQGPPPEWEDLDTPPPGYFDDTVVPDDPPDWCGKTDPEGFPIRDDSIFDGPQEQASLTQEERQSSNHLDFESITF